MKINELIKTSKNIWVTSDTHYSHTNICRGVSMWDWKSRPDSVRDFDTLSQMNEALVNNINKVVEQDDLLIHVGDWSFGGFERIPEFRSRIICENIIQLTGNHDHHIKNNRNGSRELFTHVSKMEELQIGKDMFTFCHFPMKSWIEMDNGSYMLYGHMHSKGEKRFINGGRSMDVGIDGHPEFRPYHITEILELLKDKTNKEDRHK